VRTISAYGRCRDGSGRVLLVRGRDLPGGTVRHGEHPFAAVVRAFRELAGVAVAQTRLRDASAEVVRPDLHVDRLLFEVAVTGGTPGPGVDWAVGDDGAMPPPEALPEPRPDRVQRFGAYGFVTDPAGRVLLTLIARGYPGAGRWHLPGGGTDFGEQPADSLRRELVEEGGQTGRVTAILGLSHAHNPAALGPEGRPMDWHVVRVHYRVEVPVPSVAAVTEAAGGSTADARWFAPAELRGLRLTDVAAAVITEGLGDGARPR
jgi:8-oxo-dGTP diphosphatase